MKFLYLLSLLPNILMIFFFKKFVDQINIFDEPDQIRKIHSKKVPIIGGVVIFINILILLVVEFTFENFSISYFNLYGLDQFLLILFVLIFLFSIGLFDDAYNLNANYRILFLLLIISYYYSLILKHPLNIYRLIQLDLKSILVDYIFYFFCLFIYHLLFRLTCLMV